MHGFENRVHWHTSNEKFGFSAFRRRRQKRQSDQRMAELETILNLQKYRGNRLRDHKTSGGSYSPGYGIIDFNMM